MIKILDLFCGQGGAAMGYHRALDELGIEHEITGIDINRQPRYPFEFIQADALAFADKHGRHYDFIHASPPCQAYSVTAPLSNGNAPKLVEIVRSLLWAAAKPYVIENVPGAPLRNYVMLCGSMFGLRVYRHRLFECDPIVMMGPASCNHWGELDKFSGNNRRREIAQVVGKPSYKNAMQIWSDAMGIDWMSQSGLSQAIPPAYTHWLGLQMFRVFAEAIE